MNLSSLLDNCQDQQVFLTDLLSHRSYSYQDLHQASARLHLFLGAKHVSSGDKIVYVTVNTSFFFPLLFACAARKAALVPLNPKMHIDEISNIVKQLQPKVVFYDEEWAGLEGIFKDFEKVPVQGRDMFGGDAFLNQGGLIDLPVLEDGDARIALIIYTSGTTAHCKGVGLTHKNLYGMAKNLASFYDFHEGQKFLSMLPFYHINAPMITGLACIFSRAHVVIGDLYGFALAKSFWDIVALHKIQVLSITPSIMASLLALYPQGTLKDVSSVEYALVGTAYLNAAIWKDFEERFCISCFQGYGLTETTTWATMTPRDGRKRYDSAGIPVGCEVRIVPQDFSVVDGLLPGSGEVLIKGDIVMKGYWGNPDATKAVLADGWLKTGDFGFIDKDGQLVIVGRAKNIIKRKGQLVVPEDIDAVLGRYPGILESCTFGIPDNMLGEAVVSVYVQKGRITGNAQDSLYDFLSLHLSQQNMPDQLIPFGGLPKNDLGKVNLKCLKEYVTGKTSRDIFAIFDKARYRKAKTPDQEAIFQLVQAALAEGTSLYLSGYWGVGQRDFGDAHDRAVLDNLRKLVDEVNQVVAKPLVRIKIILCDIHGRCNYIPEVSAQRYFDAIHSECRQRGFECVYLSQIWSQAGLIFEDVLKQLSSEGFKKAWDAFSLKDQFLKQAGRRGMHEDIECGAQRYYAIVMAEREAVSRYLEGTIFFTHNGQEYQGVNPSLPTIYIHSIKPGVSEKPWFMAPSQESST
ncbi:MAG: class I adenylate-forming enzyme family protein [Candidatus Omnitrophota bacterium]